MENNYPKITIVTPSYNQADFLEETILSIINQNYPNLEYIIIDGGSTDGSVEIIKKYEKYINYWVSEKDFGQSHAINKGFAKATGEVLNWINSDDVLCENALFEIARAYSNRKDDNVIIVGHGFEIDENSKIIRERNVELTPVLNIGNRLNINDVSIQQSMFFSKNIFQEVGGVNLMIQYPMDIDLQVKFAYIEPEIVILDSFLASFRKHSNSKTVSQDYKMLLEKINLLKFLNFYEKDKSFFENQISAYITGFSFENISLKQKIDLIKKFLSNTPFNKKTRYKYRVIFSKFLLTSKQ